MPKKTATPKQKTAIDATLKFISEGERFTSKSFYKEVASAFLQENADELLDAVADLIKNSKSISFQSLSAIVHIANVTKSNTDAIALALLEHPHLLKMFKEDGWRVVSFFTSATDEVFLQFMRKYPDLINSKDDYSAHEIILRFVKIKTPHGFDAATADKINLSVKKAARKGKGDRFKSDIPILVYISKLDEEGAEIFKKRYDECIELLEGDRGKNHWYRKEYTYALIRAIKDVRNKELRKSFIRSMLVKKRDDFNQILLKYYPKYTNYVAMT